MADELGGSPGSQGDGEDDPFAVVFDEDFVRAATFREPSARARMLASRWREQPTTETEAPPKRRWLGRRLLARRRRPKQAPSTKGTRKRRPWVTSVVTALVLVLVAAIGAWRISTLVGGVDGSNGATVADPFAGTPAADYGRGDSGILLPDAVALSPSSSSSPSGGASAAASSGTSPSAAQTSQTSQASGAPAPGTQAPGTPTPGTPTTASRVTATQAPGGGPVATPQPSARTGFTADEVENALIMAKQILVDANLDSEVWAGNIPVAYLADMSGSVTAVYQDALASPLPAVETPNDPLYYVTRFDPKSAVVFDVRTHGTLSVAASDTGNYLQVHADVLFVYAVHSPDGPSSPFALVVVRRVVDFRFTFTAVAGGGTIVQPSLADSQYDVSPIVCGRPDGLVHPVMPGAPVAQASTHIDAHPYDQGPSVPFPGCGASESPDSP